MSYFFKATLPLKPATIALEIGHLAFQVPRFSDCDVHEYPGCFKETRFVFVMFLTTSVE